MPRIAQEFADIPFARLVAGSVHRTHYALTADLVAAYDRLVGPDSALPAPDGTRVVPPYLYCTFLPIYRALGGRMEQGSVHTHQRVEQRGPAYIGDVLDVDVTVAAAEFRAGRPTVVLDTVYARKGVVVCRATATILWGYAAQ
jgi:acyl dehydratase